MGMERVSMNGYTYVKMPEGTKPAWKLKHHIIAEKILERTIDTKVERVLFKDRNRKNFAEDNIIVVPKQGITKEARRAQIVSRIQELEGELADLDEEEEEAS
jgi:hypothetical protein